MFDVAAAQETITAQGLGSQRDLCRPKKTKGTCNNRNPQKQVVAGGRLCCLGGLQGDFVAMRCDRV
jgi:hypothetical protein